VTIDHDLKLLRKKFAWGIRERLLTATPLKVAGENVIRLDRSLRANSGSPPRKRSGPSRQRRRTFAP
jgi:hypothetical protein